MERMSEGELTDAVGRVALISDDMGWAASVGDAMSADGFALTQLCDLVEVDRALELLEAEVVIIDGRTSDALGGRCAAVRAETDALLLAVGEVDGDVVAATVAGADAFALRSASTRVLIARVRALLRRHGRVAPPKLGAVLAIGSLKIVMADDGVVAGEHELLVDRDSYAILAALLHRPGVVVPRARLLKEIGRGQDAGSHLDLAVRRVRDQLEPHAGRHCIVAVRGVGYRLDEPEVV